MFARIKQTGPYAYLQIVESYREGGRVRQRVVATLGRLDVLQDSGRLDALVRSLCRYGDKAKVVRKWREGKLSSEGYWKVGPDLVFARLWEELGMGQVVSALAASGRHEFNMERAVYLSVVHRLMESGSDRQAERWRRDYVLPGTERLEYHHLLRAMKWLGWNREEIEEGLFERRQDLFTTVTMSFFDTTSIYFEGNGGQRLGRWGHSKDHRPDLKQLILGVLLCGDGRPVSTEIWPGNRADSTVLVPVVKRLRERFGVRDVCVVADRGMVSDETVKGLDKGKIDYILGMRMRGNREVNEEVLSRGGRFRQVASNLEVKEVYVEGKRYIVCHNWERHLKDRADRRAILSLLEEKLAKGQKQLVGNKGFRKYLCLERGAMKIDWKKVEEEERYDGKFVLRTSTALSASQVAVQYKRLWEVEDFFRSVKSLVETRPVYHKWDSTISGHIFVSFLALSLRYELMRRLEGKGLKMEWNDIRRDLDALGVVRVETPDGRWLLRTPAQGVCGKVFQAVGVALPPTAQRLESAKM